jgi:hypothetical protein
MAPRLIAWESPFSAVERTSKPTQQMSASDPLLTFGTFGTSAHMWAGLTLQAQGGKALPYFMLDRVDQRGGFTNQSPLP